MMDHWVSVSVVRIKVASHLATLNHSNHDLGILKRQHTLAEILKDEIGVPCAQIDVENGRKKTIFLPNQVPNTETVRLKLSMLKRHLFPELLPEEFLSRKSEFDLKTVPIDQCPLATRMF